MRRAAEDAARRRLVEMIDKGTRMLEVLIVGVIIKEPRVKFKHSSKIEQTVELPKWLLLVIFP